MFNHNRHNGFHDGHNDFGIADLGLLGQLDKRSNLKFQIYNLVSIVHPIVSIVVKK